MLDKTIRILNLDGSILKQSRLISQYRTQIIDLSELGPQVRLWNNKKTSESIRERIRGSFKNAVTFLGSGDFHHLSQILISEFSQPLLVIIFDFHPDWDILPPRMGCGSWVSRILESKNILKTILIGVSSDDISSGYLQTGNLPSLKDNRLEIYPYAHKPSWVFLRKIPENISFQSQRNLICGRIYWRQLKNENLKEFFLEFIKRMPTRQVYVSVDKDCLKSKYALTNWEDGLASLEELLSALKIIKENLDIVGMDIVGDYSPVRIAGKVKNFFSDLDHPKEISATKLSDSALTAVNEETNLKILEALGI